MYVQSLFPTLTKTFSQEYICIPLNLVLIRHTGLLSKACAHRVFSHVNATLSLGQELYILPQAGLIFSHLEPNTSI